MTDATYSPADVIVIRARNGLLAAAALWTGAFLSGFVLFEPAPYDLYMACLTVVSLLCGLAVPRSTVFLLVMLALFNVGGIISALQLTRPQDQVLYIAISLFLALTSVFIASIVASRAEALRVIFNGWTAGALLTGLAGIGGYFGLIPGSDLFTLFGRAKGAFQDPNVFAPFLVLPAIFCLQAILTDRGYRFTVPVIVLGVLTLAIFLSFSRAGWGLFLFCMTSLIAVTFMGSRSGRYRLRLIMLSVFILVFIGSAIAIALQFEAVRELFAERARFVQYYDGGQDGRFGRHWAGFLSSMENPLGIGPMEFGKIYGEDTHNIWLKALFDYSWLGFAAYLTLIVVTLAGGFRLLFRDRPWQRYLQCAYIVFIGHIVIGNVIDTDHWRHFYLLLGIIWGCIALEARFLPRPKQEACR